CMFLCQAEDGIRCRNVTGVQPCALPILMRSSIGCSLGGAPRSRALLHAPMAQSAEAADLKSAQSGFESRWGHARRDPARGPPSATMEPMTSSADDTALHPERREQLAASLDDDIGRIAT